MRRWAYLAAVPAVALATVGTLMFRPWMGPSVSLLYFPAVVLIAIVGGYGPSLFATVLSTASLAYFIVEPRYSFDIGADDAVRLTVFATVAVATAWLSAARRDAEESQRRALHELRGAIATLRRVAGWPTFVGAGLAAGATRVLQHAASVAGCAAVVAAWEVDEEPWLQIAHSTGVGIDRHAPDAITALSAVEVGATLGCRTPEGLDADASAPFELQHLRGRVFFVGLADRGGEVLPLAEAVAREVGNTLEQLHVSEQLRQVAVREDRIRVARDLHDGVLQSLTGIRLQLQLSADRPAAADIADRLLAMERAIAIEQRELRRFIDSLKPATPAIANATMLGILQNLRDTLSAEWQAVVTVQVTPPELELQPAVQDGIRLMVKEAAVNALKHAQPSRVAIDVRLQESGELLLRVSSDGRGFRFRGRVEHRDLAMVPGTPVSLRERVEELGGTLTIESEPTGSLVEIALPGAPTAYIDGYRSA